MTTNATERPEDTVRRLAGELHRLAEGLTARGFPLRDGPISGSEVDTALAVIDDLREATAAWEKIHPSYDRIVSHLVRELRAEGFVS